MFSNFLLLRFQLKNRVNSICTSCANQKSERGTGNKTEQVPEHPCQRETVWYLPISNHQQEQTYVEEPLQKQGAEKACRFLSSLLQHLPKLLHNLPAAVELIFIIQNNEFPPSGKRLVVAIQHDILLPFWRVHYSLASQIVEPIPRKAHA